MIDLLDTGTLMIDLLDTLTCMINLLDTQHNKIMHVICRYFVIGGLQISCMAANHVWLQLCMAENNLYHC